MSIPTQRARFVTSYFQGSKTLAFSLSFLWQGSFPGGGPASLLFFPMVHLLPLLTITQQGTKCLRSQIMALTLIQHTYTVVEKICHIMTTYIHLISDFISTRNSLTRDRKQNTKLDVFKAQQELLWTNICSLFQRQMSQTIKQVVNKPKDHLNLYLEVKPIVSAPKMWMQTTIENTAEARFHHLREADF